MPKQSIYALAVNCYDPDRHGSAKQYCERLKLNYQSFANKKSQMKKEAQAQDTKERKASIYKSAVNSYDPQIHGSAKNFCKLLGLNYQCFANKKSQMKKEAQKAQIQAEKRSEKNQDEKTADYRLYCQELEMSGETIKAFCQRKGLSYNKFRSSWKQYEKEKGSHLTRKEREKKNFARIFNGQKAFLKIIPSQEVLND